MLQAAGRTPFRAVVGATLTVVILTGGSAFVTTAEALKTYSCGDTTKPDYNTLICKYPTKLGAEKFCAKLATSGRPYDFDKSGFVDSAKKRYRMRLGGADVSGCDPAGSLKTSYYTKLRKGPSGAFVRNSKINSFVGLRQFTISKTINLAIDCAQPGMAGSAVETEVRNTWTPAKGWGTTKRTVVTYDSKSDRAC